MRTPKLEDLTKDPQLLLCAKLALKAVHTLNPNSGQPRYPDFIEIESYVARGLMHRADQQSAEAFGIKLKEVKSLGVVGFLRSNNYIEPYSDNRYCISKEIVANCSQFYEGI